MSIADQVFSQACFMAQELTAENEALLEVVCQAAVTSLTARLRDNLTPDDCLSDFVTAAGMYALAAMSEIGDWGQIQQLTAGDVTIHRGKGDGAANYLRTQADMLMAPYLKQSFLFSGV